MTTKIQENEQECLLCLKMADLQCSHIVPAFVFRWMKRSSISRTLRSAQAPNRRIQDGPKRPWLCRECESRLSGWETDFANKLFHPILADGRATHRYSSWMALFCASLCWRTLKLARLEVECNFLQADRLSLTDKALHRWREFIFGRAADPGKFELHFIPLDGIVSAVGGELHPFINRYLALGVDAEILEDEANLMVYVKLPRMVILGMVQPESLKAWKGTRVRIKEGSIYPRAFPLPKVFFAFLNHRAEFLSSIGREISHSQRKKISNTLEADLSVTASSVFAEALRLDIGLSGVSAALPGLKNNEDD